MFKGDRAFSRPTAVWATTRDVAMSRQDNPSGTFAESSSHCYRNCPNTVGTHNQQISPKTVGSRLREIGLRARPPYIGLPLTQACRLRRMVWLTAHAPRLFPMRQWRRVLFTDESRFTLYRADGGHRVYRHRG